MSKKILSPCKNVLNDKIEHATPTAVGGVAGKGSGIVLPETSLPAASKAKQLGRGMGCVWTLFEYDKYLQDLKRYAVQDCTYAVWGYEVCPETKRPHLQGYVHWKNPRSLGAFSSRFGDCHVEKPIGTAAQNRAYCLKIRDKDKVKNEKWEEYGELPVQGKRKDWEEVYTELQKGSAVQDVIESSPAMIPYIRHIREVKQMLMKPLNRDVEVIVLYGRGGTGKTRWAWDNYPELFPKPTNKSSGSWWNGYEGQEVVLLDDYYGGIAYHEFLRVLDRYAYSAPICGGGYVWAQWNKVLITSNQHPRHWYKSQWGWPLRRRLNKIIQVTSIDGEAHFEEEAFPADEEAWRHEEANHET